MTHGSETVRVLASPRVRGRRVGLVDAVSPTPFGTLLSDQARVWTLGDGLGFLRPDLPARTFTAPVTARIHCG
jgi:hypothetical protein